MKKRTGNLSGLVFPKQVFNQVYTIYLYALVKINSFIQSSTEVCISVAQDCMQTQKQQETLCLSLELVGPCVVLGFSVGMEAFDELLSITVPWSQDNSLLLI